jgi:O-antigen ligase
MALLRKDTSQKKLYWLLFGACNVIIIGLAIAEAKWYYLLIAIAPFFIYCSIKNPFILPFGLYVFLVPFDRILDVIGFAQGATLTKFVGILTILVLSLKGTFENKIIKPDPASLVMMLLVTYCVLTNIWAIKPEMVFSKVPTLVSLFVFYLIASSYKIKAEEYNVLKWCILLGGILAAALTLKSFESGAFYGHSQRATIAFGDEAINPNTVAISLLLPLSISLQMMLSDLRKSRKALFVCIFLLLSYAVIITGSRKSLLGLVVILAFYISHTRNKMVFGAFVSAAMMVLLLAAPEYFTERVGLSLEDRGAGRLDIWYVGIKALQRYWMSGAGLGNFPLAFNEFINEGAASLHFSRGAHNHYLMILIETGIVGLSLMLWTLIKHYQLLKSRLVKYDLDFIMLKASFWSIMTAGLFADIFYHKSFWLLLMMIVMYRNAFGAELQWKVMQDYAAHEIKYGMPGREKSS